MQRRKFNYCLHVNRRYFLLFKSPSIKLRVIYQQEFIDQAAKKTRDSTRLLQH